MNLFITGTDTDVGKTYVSAKLLTAFNQLGYSTLGIKPLASGCDLINNELLSPDTHIHMQHSSIKLSHQQVTPFAFAPPIAPHLAAQQAGCLLSVEELNRKTHFAMQHPADIKIIEGCGGWYVPLNAQETMADFVIANNLQVILVVGIRLGCINHALLSAHALQHDRANFIGWIANCIDPDMKMRDENIATLKQRLPTPCLGTF
jgi:dethiobiotin synthetase